jgi:hypothetical protein
MPKNIVLLSDGTGNSAGKLQKTNVWRLYDTLDLPHPPSPEPPEQIAYYDDGVGSSSFRPYAMLGGAIGVGLKRNVIDLYTFLCWNYAEGDRIYAFGFSRGAFTIRVLVGLVNNQGLVQADTQDDLKTRARDAYRRYRERYVTVRAAQKPARMLRNAVLRVPEKSSVPAIPSPQFAFLGVWDTVSAYGLPFDELTRAWNLIMPLSVPDRNLCGNIDRACHAISIDDERQTFHPVLWNEEGLPDEARIQDERLTQVWFPGVHANLGGGYPDDGLSNVSLNWMMTEAARLGVLFKPGALRTVRRAAEVYGKLYDARRGLGGAYRYLPRKIARLTHNVNPRKEADRVIITRPKFHESVFQRIAHGTDAYAPIGLPAAYAVVAEDGTIHDLPAPVVPVEVRETAAEAEGRARRQEQVWNFVWWRRVVYFLAVSAALFLLAVFPLLFPAQRACREPLCFMSPLIEALGAILPGAMKPLLAAYATHPLAFLITLALFAGLLHAGGRLRAHIAGRMHHIWTSPPSAGAAEPGGLLYAFRSSPAYRWTWRQLQARVLPWVFAVIVIWLLVAGASNTLFSVMNASGAICTPTKEPLAAHMLRKEFETRSPCWASGVRLTEGVRYRIAIEIREPWRDGVDEDAKRPGIPSDLSGFGKTTLRMFPGLPFRRYVSEKWFKPVARIGSEGSDEYVLDPGDTLVEGSSRLVTELTARSSGELFLFVNDTVFPLPRGWTQPTYANNRGTASVIVAPVRRDAAAN